MYEWLATLKAIHAALRPGGYLAFESRNPDNHAWEVWNREASYQQCLALAELCCSWPVITEQNFQVG